MRMLAGSTTIKRWNWGGTAPGLLSMHSNYRNPYVHGCEAVFKDLGSLTEVPPTWAF